MCAILGRWQQANLPGTLTVEVSLRLATGAVLPMPFVAGQTIQLPTPAVPAPPADDWQPFVPTPFQRAILAALDGKAMHARALGTAVGDASRLYKPGGVQELRERGLVELHARLGFYRPDVPPQEISDAEQNEEPQ